MKYELAICVVTEPNHRPDTKRKDEGDIVAIRPHPWNWGAKEIDEFLIVIIETARSFDKLNKLISQSVYREIATDNLINDLDYVDLINPEIGNRPESDFVMEHKNRFQISHAKVKARLSDLNLTKVRNKLTKYQPFKNRSQLAQKFNGLNNNRLITESECDCNSIHADNNTEFSINLDALPPFIFDKFTGQLVKP